VIQPQGRGADQAVVSRSPERANVLRSSLKGRQDRAWTALSTSRCCILLCRLRSPTTSAGAGHTGTAGKVDNAQVAVYLAYATTAGHRVIDRELYLPRGWLADAERCQVAGVPDRVGLATKPKLARVMLDRALEAGVPAGWVTCRWLPWSRSPEPAGGSRRRLQAGKGLCGLDQHQVPPLALLVPLGDLGPAGIRVLGGGRSHPTRPPPTTVGPHPVDLQRAPAPVRHARRRPITHSAHRLRWSWWRRRHQARARACHDRQQPTDREHHELRLEY